MLDVNKMLAAMFAATKAIIDAMAKAAAEPQRPQGHCYVRFLPVREGRDRLTGEMETEGLLSVWFDDGRGGVSCLN